MKQACSYVGDFEMYLAAHAREQGCDGCVCGHIHTAALRTGEDGFLYANTGDWVESCSAIIEDEMGQLSLWYIGDPLQLDDWSELSTTGATILGSDWGPVNEFYSFAQLVLPRGGEAVMVARGQNNGGLELANFGETVGTLRGSLTAVPEPGTITLAAMGVHLRLRPAGGAPSTRSPFSVSIRIPPSANILRRRLGSRAWLSSLFFAKVAFPRWSSSRATPCDPGGTAKRGENASRD